MTNYKVIDIHGKLHQEFDNEPEAKEYVLKLGDQSILAKVVPTCTREDLRACINIPSYWGVNDDGSIGNEHYGEGYADNDNFGSYKCEGCDQFFDAWKDALGHLSVEAKS